MYMASMFRSQSLYGTFIGFPYKDFSKVLLLSLPFLIPGLPVWVHRAWEVLLSVSLTALSAWLLIRRLKINNNYWRWVGGMGSFLFLFQGPIYNFLLVSVILMLAWFNPRSFWRSSLILCLSTIWACLSRVNWFPYPLILAVSLYLLETPFPQKWYEYFRKPVGWLIMAVVAAGITLILYYFFPTNQTLPLALGTFTTPLTWRRLLPNPTYPLGLIPAITIISLPFAVLILLNVFGGRIRWIRVTLTALILAVIFIGCSISSIKLGGGNNLHNYDMFYFLLLVCGSYMISESIILDKPNPPFLWKPALACAFIVPVIFSLSYSISFSTRDRTELMQELSDLNTLVETANQNGETVLFISERQLCTFEYLHPVPFETDFEVNILMEMAMANNQSYLQLFYARLQNHDFDYIVVGRLFDGYQLEDVAFFAENNLWVDRVVFPILENYQMERFYSESGLAVYVPR